MKQRYAAGHQQQENKSILLFRMGRIVCFHLLRPSAAQENEWMKEEKTKWKFVFDEWMVSFLAEKERARQLSFFLGGLRAAASRRQPAKKRDERRAVEQTNKIIQFEKEWTNWLFLWLRGGLWAICSALFLFFVEEKKWDEQRGQQQRAEWANKSILSQFDQWRWIDQMERMISLWVEHAAGPQTQQSNQTHGVEWVWWSWVVCCAHYEM